MDITTISIPLLFVISIFAIICYRTQNTFYVRKYINNGSEFFLINALSGFVCAFFILLNNGFRLNLSQFSLWMGLAFGLVTATQTVANNVAVKIGPYGYTNLIINLSCALTAILGAIFWHEEITLLKVCGIALMIICFVLAVKVGDDDKSKVNLKWFWICVGCLVLTTCIGLLQKGHQGSDFAGEINEFLIVAFLFSATISFLGYIFIRKKESKLSDVKNGMSKAKLINFVLVVILSGLFVALNFVINLYLSGVVNSTVFFPIVNGIPLIIYIILSFILFKEKLTKKQICGLVFGVFAVVCLIV